MKQRKKWAFSAMYRVRAEIYKTMIVLNENKPTKARKQWEKVFKASRDVYHHLTRLAMEEK